MDGVGARPAALAAVASVLAGAGAVGVAAATVGIYVLDRRGVAAGFDAVHHTLSEAVWRPGGVWFGVALAALAVGVAAVAAGMAMVGELRRSALAWLLVASGGLLVAGVVPTGRPLTTPGFSSYVHLGAIVVAATALPLGAIAAACSSTWPRRRPAAAAATVLAVAALPTTVYVATVAVSWLIATHGWEPLPLGKVQRLLAADESLLIVALGLHTVLTATAARWGHPELAKLRSTNVQKGRGVAG
jgi:Protein of unknown function (DUF998)